MKYLVHSSIDLHVCFEEEGGGDVIAFDLYHKWDLPECRRGVLCGDDLLIRVESNQLATDDMDDMAFVGFKLRYLTGKKLQIQLGTGRRARKFPIRGWSNGGNIYWEIIHLPARRTPHVLNWLRWQRNFSKSEWVEDFMPLWESRRALDVPALLAYELAAIKQELRRQAKAIGCTVSKLIELSKPLP